MMERPFSDSAKLAKDVTWQIVGSDMPLGTWLQRTQNSDGQDAIKIVIVFPDARANEVTGEQLIEIMSSIRRELPSIGEDRFPIVSFARMRDEPELEGDNFSASARAS